MNDSYNLAIVGIMGGIAGGLITWLLNEWSKNRDRALVKRSHQLDLYKLVYPEKVKAAVTLMNKAGAIRKDIRLCYLVGKDPPEIQRLELELVEMLVYAEASEALLGEVIVTALNDFRMACLKLTNDDHDVRRECVASGNELVYEAPYRKLVALLREAIFLDILDGLFKSER